MKTSSRKNVRILAFTLLVVMLGYGMVMPVMPFLIEQLGAGGTELGWLVSTYSLMQLICAPLWGMLSDRTGRKPVIAIGVLGYAVTMFLFGLATEFWMLFVASTLAGMLSSAAMPTAMAYISDNAPESERSGGMGQLGAAIGAGVIARTAAGRAALQPVTLPALLRRCRDGSALLPAGGAPAARITPRTTHSAPKTNRCAGRISAGCSTARPGHCCC